MLGKLKLKLVYTATVTLVFFVLFGCVLHLSADDSALEEKSSDDAKYYSLHVDLMHAYEEKESMGNSAMNHNANLLEKNGSMTLYLGSKKMEISGITASLVAIYYDNGEEYRKALPHAFDMRVEGEDELRPKVFTIPLEYKDEILNVMVDPKVEPMGDDPIKARLKIEFDEMKEIKKDEAELVLIAEKGSKKTLFDPNKSIKKKDKGVVLSAEGGVFDKDIEFYANRIKGEKLKNISILFGDLAQIDAYNLMAFAELEHIPYDATNPINEIREVLQPKGKIKLSVPYDKDVRYTKVYAIKSEAEEIPFVKSGENLLFDYDALLDFAVVYDENFATAANKRSISSSKNASDTSKVHQNKDAIDTESLYTHENTHMGTLHRARFREIPEIIILSIITITSVLGLGIYFSIKYYNKLLSELRYNAELKLEYQNAILESKNTSKL